MPEPTPPPSSGSRDVRMRAVGPALVTAFRRVGLPGVWGLAFARQESDFTPGAVNRSAADARRGFSWGLCQMSLQTARESLGYEGEGPGLLVPEVNARLAAQFCQQLCHNNRVTDLGNIASLYNSGRRLERAPESTRSTYVPRVLSYAAALASYADSLPPETRP